MLRGAEKGCWAYNPKVLESKRGKGDFFCLEPIWNNHVFSVRICGLVPTGVRLPNLTKIGLNIPLSKLIV